MSKGLMMFCYAVFALGTILGLISTGRWFTNGDMNIINSITSMSGAQISALSGIPVVGPTIDFFNGAFQIILWNYPFLNNAFGFILKFVFLFPVSFGVIVGFVEIFQQIAQGIAGFIRNLWPV